MDYRFLILPFVFLILFNATLDDKTVQVIQHYRYLSWSGRHIRGDYVTGLLNAVLVNIVVLIYTLIPLALYARLTARGRDFLIEEVKVLLAYTNLTILMTYPLILHVGEAIPGHGDAWLMMWYLWGGKQSILNFSNPYYTALWFAPYGKNLIFHSNILFISLLSIPLQLTMSLAGAYSIMNLLGFVWSGYGMYILVRYLTKHEGASFVSGVIFGFSPYRFARLLGHLNLVHTEWIPLYLLFLLKTLDSDEKKYPILAGFFLVAASTTFIFYAVVLFLMTVIILADSAIRDRKSLLNEKAIKRLSMIVLTTLLLMAPALKEIAEDYRPDLMSEAKLSSIFSSADVVAYIIPHAFHPLFGGMYPELRKVITSNLVESTVHIGPIVLTLALLSLVDTRKLVKKLKGKSRAGLKKMLDRKTLPELWKWIIITLVFFTLSLGPVLHFGGIVVAFKEKTPESLTYANGPAVYFSPLVSFYNFLGRITGRMAADNPNPPHSPIYLPYEWLIDLPFLEISRTPSRYCLGVITALSVLSGYALSKTLKGKQDVKVMALLTTLILFEYLAVPFMMSNVPKLPEIYSILGQMEGDFIVHEKPSDAYKYLYTQTIHGKKILSGYLKSESPDVWEMLEDNANENKSANILEFCRRKNVGYLIIHKKKMTEIGLNETLRLFKTKPFHEDQQTITYRIT